jgi:DNA-directed RNA polymerase subunit beta
LKENGVVKIGTVIDSGDILVGKVIRKPKKTVLMRLLGAISKENHIKDISLRFPKSFSGTVTKVELFGKKSKSSFHQVPKKKASTAMSVTVYVTEKRKIEIGDKVAGRHGNKGIISKILPICDMPYLPDGTIIDMILNPLGIPSRMNVGQVFEGLLNLAAINLNERYNIQPFDEVQQDKSSQVFVYKRLNQARKKTRKSWLFDPNCLGKALVFDGRNGNTFQQEVSIGFAYIMKLVHLVKDKIHSRSIGPYSLVVKQPLRGRSKNGGQRFGEMEVWAMEGFGAAYSLQELLTIKSDDVANRLRVLNCLIKDKKLPQPGIPEAFKVFILELQSLGFDIRIFTQSNKNFH